MDIELLLYKHLVSVDLQIYTLKHLYVCSNNFSENDYLYVLYYYTVFQENIVVLLY